ncbi:hypothetical protein KO500_16795 [Cellulophaga baltica]|uniref:hypothetical protein n=1 Tax=Cellulophaga TaxID=104264 RepID=UPI001C07A197|nr:MULTISPECIES: hypothetical protein [Cellulophaga]MBU2998102.1 hypothetical protein [Cellulophaga baltica]MDO6769504.1 hypothetical protein [Cellulophaga sp. 1_MG-2023]
MPLEVGQKAIFTLPNGKQEEVTILKRAIDYEKGYIDEFNVKGNFDYFVSVIRNSKTEQIFCNESELTQYE